MATNIVLKRSATEDAVPSTGDLELGEVALNTYDGKMYMKKTVSGTSSIVELTGTVVASSSAFAYQAFKYTASSNQTTFIGSDANSVTLAYTAGAIQVFLNGILLDVVDYTASNGTSVVLDSGADSGDILYISSYKGTDPLDYFKYVATNGQTSFSGNDANSVSLIYTVGNIAVYLNGVLLDATDYTATTGTSVVLDSGATTDDILTIWEFNEAGLTDVANDTTPQLSGDLDVNGNDIVSTSNAHINVIPHGTGNVTLQTDTLQLGSSGENVTVTTSGTGDITLNTNSGTNSGSIVIADGANADITIATNGSGAIVLNGGATVTGPLTVTGTLTGTLGTATQTTITSVGTLSSLAVGNITTTGYLRGPASFTIDPATHGDDTGTVVIAGNLQVDGTTTTINSTTVSIDDLNFSIATDAANSAAANGAGITIGGAGATLLYTHATTSWDMNKPLNVTGALGVTGLLTATGLGIGASSPSVPFAVHNALSSGESIAEFRSTGNTNSTLDIRADGTGDPLIFFDLNGATPFAIGVDNSDGDKFKISGGYQLGANDRLVIDSSGRVGIGTSSPASILHILDSTDGGASLSTAIQFGRRAGTGDNAYIQTLHSGSDAVSALTFKFGSSERMRIASSGRQTYDGSSTATGHGNFVGEVGASYKALMFEHTNGGGEVGTIVTTSSTTSYNTSSDYRLKENIVTDWDATTRLKQLKPSRFNFIIDDTKTVDGFLAHEVSSIVPEAITGEKDAMTTEVLYVEGDELPEGKSIGDVKTASVPAHQGIDQSKLVPLLVKTIQELEARITALEG